MSIDELVGRITAAVAAPDFGPERASDILAEVLAVQGDWMSEDLQRRESGADWMLHPIYRAPDGRASILVAVFGPGAVTPAHDHGAWAVVGTYRGREREIRYRRAGTGLEIACTLVNPRGAVSVIPPDAIHSVEALDGRDAVSIHIYGTDIVTQRRSTYDTTTGEATPFAPDFTSAGE